MRMAQNPIAHSTKGKKICDKFCDIATRWRDPRNLMHTFSRIHVETETAYLVGKIVLLSRQSYECSEKEKEERDVQ